MRTALVVPTNRPEQCVEFLKRWQHEPWDEILIVEDAPRPSVNKLVAEVEVLKLMPIVVYSHEDIDREERPHIFSKGDSAIRSFGFLQAWRRNCDYVVTLDDDCYPSRAHGTVPYLVHQHLSNLGDNRFDGWVSTIPGERVRGLPYDLSGEVQCAVSVGLWCGHLDYDAPTSLEKDHRPASDEWIRDKAPTRILPANQFWPMCGMNLAFRRSVLPLMYFPRMGEDSPYARFDDIWCGMLAQVILRHLGLSGCAGAPYVSHTRLSDPRRNLIREAPGIRDHERLWRYFYPTVLCGKSVFDGMREMAGRLIGPCHEDALVCGLPFAGYLRQWGTNILIWCDLLEQRHLLD